MSAAGPTRASLLARALAGFALALLGAGCAMFESERPMFPPATGAPLYGTAPALVRWQTLDPDEKDKVLKIDATFADGVYAMSARGKDKAQFKESLHPTTAIKAAPGANWYVQQIEYAGDSREGPPTFYYDLVRADASGMWAYQLRCSDLSTAERDQFGMTPPPSPPNPDGTPAAPSTSCTVRSPESLQSAFALIAGRIEARVRVTAKPKGKGWFSRP